MYGIPLKSFPFVNGVLVEAWKISSRVESLPVV